MGCEDEHGAGAAVKEVQFHKTWTSLPASELLVRVRPDV